MMTKLVVTKKWEHEVDSVMGPLERDRILQKRSEEGWELVAVANSHSNSTCQLYWKRPYGSDPKRPVE